MKISAIIIAFFLCLIATVTVGNPCCDASVSKMKNILPSTRTACNAAISKCVSGNQYSRASMATCLKPVYAKYCPDFNLSGSK